MGGNAAQPRTPRAPTAACELVVHFFLASALPSATLNWPAAQPRPPRGRKQGKPKTRRRLLHAPRGWPLMFSEIFLFYLAIDLTSGKINTQLAALRGESRRAGVVFLTSLLHWLNFAA